MARLTVEFTELSRGIYFFKVRHPVLFSYNWLINKACKITENKINFVNGFYFLTN